MVLIGQQPRGFEHEEPIDPDRMPNVIRRYSAEDGEYFTLGDSRSLVRLRFEPGIARHGSILLPTERYATIREQTSEWLLRLLCGRIREPSPEASRLTAFRRRRLAMLLRVHDLRSAGTTSRRIAEYLIDPHLASLPAAEWTERNERKRVRRWIAEAARLVGGGYRDLLHGR
ncbi:DNA -binding domain-containing protein [Sphingobium sp. B2]|uniref:DNA -binding domain-containing protein n=1 Tax=Sphingobium sp. B2 TaxID=2583228 RepID=UPI00119C9A08|nr:DUF2285 domain-containing protein [Sphingobium sp. B2]